MRTALLLFALWLVACDSETNPLPDGGNPLDAGKDAAIDSGFPDAAPDDATIDGGTEDSGVVDASDGGSDGGQCDPFDPDCIACQLDGECCAFGINCQAGSICNSASEDLFDPTQPEQICIRVVCMNDVDCPNGRVCTLENVCRVPVCQNDSDCVGGTVCLGGACASPPVVADVVSCEVVEANEALRSGGTLALEAIARDANGEILSGIAGTWSSSEPARVSVAGSVATGGNQAGLTDLTAVIGAVVCTGAIHVQNFLAIAADQVRVIALFHSSGQPIDGATVVVDALTAVTGLDGSAVVTAPGAIGQISVVATGFATVTIMSPGARDLVIPMSRLDPTVAGGYRGSVDTSSSRQADAQIAFVGEGISEDILSLGRIPLTGRDVVETVIDAPELGLNMEPFTLTGGFIFDLGNRQFFNTPARCQGNPPNADQIGCFLVRADEGYGAAWAISGELRLSQITSIANELSNVLGGAALLEISDEWMPIMRTLPHGVRPALVIEVFPRLPTGGADCADPTTPGYFTECMPDFAQYQPIAIDADQPQALATIVAMPSLPTAGVICAEAATVFGATYLGRRGLVPLGFGSASDVFDVEPADCIVAGAEQPFGPNSPLLADGTLGLSTAPRHSGLEGHPLALISVARISSPGSAAPFFRSVRIDRVASFARNMTVGPLLASPSGSVSVNNASVTFDAAGGTFVRAELYGNSSAWFVYAPGATTTIALPDVTAGRAVLANLQGAVLLRADAIVSYGAVFDLGEDVRADRNFEIIDRFAVQEVQ